MPDPQRTPTPGGIESAGVPGADTEPGAPKDGVVFPRHAEPTDEAPTIISKTPPTSSPASDTFTGSLKGRTLAHFELLGPLGVGGMAAVLRARDKQLDRIVALKILPPDMAADAENVRRFHQEARSAAKLDHENIARVYYCGEDQRLHFIAFEFVEGENLKTILERRGGRIPVPEAVRYMLQIAAGLEHAATRGVVHRDIKPSNIIITPTGRAKLVDMGLARSLERPDDQALTQSGVTLGTFDYISPEQALEPREADCRSDIYSLGCTFYHLLTGQPPVPEGTAAKKLHHHQHIAPVDPRQLNPEIPDEVAAILVRMMAKDVNERYQRPAHLMQHLLEVSKKLGGGTEVSEGMMFLDAPPLQAPRNRPLVVISFAALCLSLLLFLLSLAPPGPPATGEKPSPEQLVKDLKGKGPSDKEVAAVPPVKPALVVAADGKFYVSTEEKLAQALEDPRSNLHIVIEKRIPLSKGLSWNGSGGKTLTIESKYKEETAPKISLKYSPADLEDPYQMFAGLLIDGGIVKIHHVDFEIDAEVTPESVVAAIGIRRAERVEFNKCTFTQEGIRPKSFLSQLPSKKVPVASVAVEAVEKKPVVEFKDCVFEKGQVAIAVGSPADIKVVESIFFPHSAFFHLRGDHQSSVSLHRCSGFVTHGPAFRIDDETECKLKIEYSIFSRLDNVAAGDEDPADLIRYTTSTQPVLLFTGKRNCYHNLSSFWAFPTEDGGMRTISDLAEFHAKVLEAGGAGDPNSSTLAADSRPWFHADPLDYIKTPQRAAKLKGDLLEVRKMTTIGLGPLWVRDTGALPQIVKTGEVFALKPNEMVVDPDNDKETPQVYQTVAQAIAHAQPGTNYVILLKHSKAGLRNVDVGPEHLDKPGIDLTFKPYPGFQPILSIGETVVKNASMFKLQDGSLRFENLDIQLEPAKAGFRSLAVVQVMGNGSCSFRNCVITLKDSDSETDRASLSVVTLLNPDEAMAMPGPRTKPEIQLQDCYVRGEGDLVRALTSRPVDLDLSNSQIVLAGSVLAMTGNTMETPPRPGVALRLANVAAFLKEPLVSVSAVTGGKTLVVMDVENAKNNLFVSLGTKPLLSFDLSDQKIDDVFAWRGGQNAYWGYEKLLDLPRSEEKLMVDDWRNKHESDLKQVSGRFTFARDFTRPLSQAQFDLFKIDSKLDLQNYGTFLTPEMLPREPERKVQPGSVTPKEEELQP